MKTYAISANTIPPSSIAFGKKKSSLPGAPQSSGILRNVKSAPSHHAPRATGLKAILLTLTAALGLGAAGCEGLELEPEVTAIDGGLSDAGERIIAPRYGGLPLNKFAATEMTTDAGERIIAPRYGGLPLNKFAATEIATDAGRVIKAVILEGETAVKTAL